ncbi:MAG: hypothetical protein AAGD05_08475, partial [Bacteroidota bacterium]
KLEEKNKLNIQAIEEKILSASFMRKATLKKQIESLRDEIDLYNSRVINQYGTLHPSAKAIRRFEKTDKTLEAIFNILHIKFSEQAFAMCPPVFRDALVFFSKNHQITGILQICFDCLWIQNEQEEDLEVDQSIFPLLQQQLQQMGHPIEEDSADLNRS